MRQPSSEVITKLSICNYIPTVWHKLLNELKQNNKNYDPKKRVANYKSHIKRQRRTCSIVNHFLDCHNADHSTLKFMLIDQRDDDLREGENFWIGMLLTNQGGLNSHHDFVQQ